MEAFVVILVDVCAEMSHVPVLNYPIPTKVTACPQDCHSVAAIRSFRDPVDSCYKQSQDVIAAALRA